MIKNQYKQSGFTLIEIMVVVVIIGLLATFILPNVMGRQDQAAQTKAKADIRTLEMQVQLYRLDNFNYPTTSEGLGVLLQGSGQGGSGPSYIDKLPKDPWDNDYQYSSPGQNNPNGVDIWSFGADGVAGGEGRNGDIGNWDG